MFCRNCGKQIPENAKFCGNCGSSVSQQEVRTSFGTTAPYSAERSRTANIPKQKNAKKKGFFSTVFRFLRGLVIAVVLFGIILAVGNKIDERKAKEYAELRAVMRSTEPTLSVEEAELAERLPDVPEHLRTVQILQHRGMGSCKSLKGNIAVTVVFVDDTVSSWAQQEIDEFIGDLYIDIADLTDQAEQWGVDLNITMYTKHCALDFEIEPESASWSLGPILSKAGYDMYDLNNSLKEEIRADAVPFVVAFNKEGRSYATQNSDEEQVQACYLFSGSDAFKHELLHLFGAADFYYHDLMDFAVTDILEDSIMRDSINDHIDDLTAYLVGWTDQLTIEAETMLYVIGYIGNDELQAAQEENVITGFGTLDLDNGGYYNGYLTMGVPDGWGEMVFPNGDSYSGEFKNGAITGYGYFVWANGDRYEGYFQVGQLHGQGTLTKANGEVYSGIWENNTFKG